MTCPRCTGDCNQGRECPHRTEGAPGLLRDYVGGFALAMAFYALLWIIFGLTG
jgi:hypothetical protein